VLFLWNTNICRSVCGNAIFGDSDVSSRRERQIREGERNTASSCSGGEEERRGGDKSDMFHVLSFRSKLDFQISKLLSLVCKLKVN